MSSGSNRCGDRGHRVAVWHWCRRRQNPGTCHRRLSLAVPSFRSLLMALNGHRSPAPRMSAFRGKADTVSCSPTCPLMTHFGHQQVCLTARSIGPCIFHRRRCRSRLRTYRCRHRSRPHICRCPRSSCRCIPLGASLPPRSRNFCLRS